MQRSQDRIGGSEIASVFGVGYGCSRRLLYGKLGITPDIPESETLAMRRGKDLEDLIAKRYSEETGRKVRRVSKEYVDPTSPLSGHIDRLITSDPRRVLEIKCLGYRTFRQFQKEGLPEDYILQLQQYMLLTGIPHGAYAILNPDSWELITFDVEADRDLQMLIRERAITWWADHMIGGAEPERLKPESKQCQYCPWRISCQGIQHLDVEPESDYTEDDSIQNLLDNYKAAKEMSDNAEEALKEATEILKEALVERQLVSCRAYKVSYKTGSRSSVDSKKLKSMYPDIYKQVTKESYSRTLRVSWN